MYFREDSIKLKIGCDGRCGVDFVSYITEHQNSGFLVPQIRQTLCNGKMCFERKWSLCISHRKHVDRWVIRVRWARWTTAMAKCLSSFMCHLSIHLSFNFQNPVPPWSRKKFVQDSNSRSENGGRKVLLQMVLPVMTVHPDIGAIEVWLVDLLYHLLTCSRKWRHSAETGIGLLLYIAERNEIPQALDLTQHYNSGTKQDGRRMYLPD